MPKPSVNWDKMREDYQRLYARYFIVLFKELDGATEHSIIRLPAESKFHERAVVDILRKYEAWDRNQLVIITENEGKVLFAEGQRVVEDRYIPDIVRLWSMQPSVTGGMTEYDKLIHDNNMALADIRNNLRK